MRRTWFVALLCAVISLLSALMLRHAACDGAKKGDAGVAPTPVRERQDGRTPSRVKTLDPAPGAPATRAPVFPEAAVRAPEEASDAALASEVSDADGGAVSDWERFIERIMEQDGTPSAEQAFELKAALVKVDKDARMECVRHAVNLLPDERFPILFAILFDRRQELEILDAIFSDALNRAEEIKNPLLAELMRDRLHPLYWEAARIQDIVGTEDHAPVNP